MESRKFETHCVQSGYTPDSSTLAAVAPIYRTSSYIFKNTEHAANLFALKELGYIYTRLNNPTCSVLEERMAAIEGGKAAVAISSGTSAIFYSVINICKAGDHIVSSDALYGGTYTMFNDILPSLGIKTTFVDINNEQAVCAAITANTKMLFCETIGNPLLDVSNIKQLAAIGRAQNLPLVVDNTFATPYIFKPLEHGANVVVESLTKWIGGHGAGIGGVVIDGANFNWAQEKFPAFNEPDSSYHGLRYAHDLGDMCPIAFALRLRLVPLRNLGACLSPDNAWLFLQGIETLALRMQRQSENALKVARHLSQHKKVSWIRYPGLPTDPGYAVGHEQFGENYGGMVVFGIKGGKAAGSAFIDALKLFLHLANVGDTRSLAIHPATTTHSQLTTEQQKQCRIGEDLVRLSIGLEHIDDIIADIDQALGK
ncbi:MAG: O-acetylhomoserine aminocarboxypropyltransferase/cysteine synthase [Deltaproteobacteria bacterium]|nr:O-acetylhomoserine aminocarboxypropyltransferase/cysteine synthase [Deltaproteobacteria bacterium]